MGRLKIVITCVCVLAGIAPSALGQKGLVVLEDGRLILVGEFQSLASIEATSELGLLSLDSLTIDVIGAIKFKSPFSHAGSTIFVDSPNSIILGVSDAENRINIEGETSTAILYSGTSTQSFTDLEVKLGFGDAEPTVFPLFLPEPTSNCLMLFSIACLAAFRPRNRQRCRKSVGF